MKKLFTKENSVAVAGMMILIILVFAGFCIYNIKSTSELLGEQVQENLTQLTESNAALVNDRLGRSRDLAATLSKGVIASPNFTMDEKMERLRSESENIGALRIGFADTQGNAVTTDNRKFYVGDRPYFLSALKGEISMSDILEDRTAANQNVMVCASPVYRKEKIQGVLFITSLTSEIEKVVNVSIFGGGGYSYVATDAGELVFCSNDEGAYRFSGTLLEGAAACNSEESCQALKNALAMRRTGVSRLKLGGDSVYVSYSPIHINNWVFVSVLPEEIVLEKSNTLYVRSTVFSGVAFLVLLSVVLYILANRRSNSLQIHKIAYEDRITGIGNYNYFQLKSGQILKNKGSTHYALVYFDIENFKVVNDTFGYEFGDRILRRIAGILQDVLCHGEIYARLSNDYFAFIMPYRNGKQEVLDMVNLIRKRFSELEAGSMARINLSFPMGIYLLREEDANVNKIINKATMAHNEARRIDAPDRCIFYSEDIRNKLNAENEIATEIKTALRNNEFEIYYQPKFVLKTGELAGYEALIRWNHPRKGLISPGEFIPIAERNGSITEIGRFVFDQVCRDIRDWMSSGYTVVPVSFNLSRVELYQGGLLEFVGATMRQYQVPSYYLEAEITETAAISGPLPIQDVIQRFKIIGIKISMDDFGTGYSSLSCLKSMPIDILKLDRSFLNDIETDVTSRNIARAVIALAKSLNLVIISEGVESRYQAEFLTEAGCDLVQGFYFGCPQQKKIAQRYMREPFGEVNRKLKEAEEQE